MKNKYRILVFPCGSEIALEVYRSLCYSSHIELFGANSVDDHGKFVYSNYIGNIPFIDLDDSLEKIKEIVIQYQIDAIYPAMDKVIYKLKYHEEYLGCKVIASPFETTEICLSKLKTYNKLDKFVKVPKVFRNIEEVKSFPVFLKPDIGYGSRGVSKIDNHLQLNTFFENKNIDDYVISEYLSGEEFTIDCFTDKTGKLRFAGARIRNRITNGISVNTKPVAGREFELLAETINAAISFRGAWFFQVKKNDCGELVLLEIASRLGGSSSLFRAIGVNFALLSIYDAFDIDVKLLTNSYYVELDRALDAKFLLNIDFDYVYVDFDDCLIIDNKVNIKLCSFIYDCINKGKKVCLITKHANDINLSLRTYRLNNLFDEVIHLKKFENKYNFITNKNAIFIDDSFAERKEVLEKLGIPVFGPDMIDVFI